MIDIINKQVEEHDKVGICDCGCHTSPHSDADMKINGCDLCYEGSEYAPRHPDKRNVLRSSMLKVAKKFANKVHEKRLLSDKYGFSEGFLHELDNDIQEYINSLTEGE